MKRQIMKIAGLGVCVVMAGLLLVNPPSGGGRPAAGVTGYPFMDTSLSFAERAADLVSRLTLEEKQNLLGNRNEGSPRLGVQPYEFWSEALHGIARQGSATSFPSPLSMASSWNTGLMRQIGDVIGAEGRGKIDENPNERYMRLSYWSPTINLARDPRWGRNEESYGEDPFLTAAMAQQFSSGLQGEGDGVVSPHTGEKYLQLIATLKHYAANNSEYNRHDGTSDMDDRTLRNFYTRAFQWVSQRMPIASVMTAYNRVNGIPATADPYLVDTLLRKTFGFNGYVVTDCGAIYDIYSRERHHWWPEGWTRPVVAREAAAFSMKAGTDLNCGDTYPAQIINAINAGLLTEDEIDVRLLNIFIARMKTGEFDPKEDVPYRLITKDVIDSEENHAIALQSARESLILLKNEEINGKKALPLDQNAINSIAVYGPLAGLCELGDYSAELGRMAKLVPFTDGLTEFLRGTNIKLDFYDGIDVMGLAGYVCNLRSVTFGTEKRNAYPADEENGSVRIDNDGANYGWIAEGDWIMYKDVGLTGLDTITIESSDGAEHDTADVIIEVRLGAPDGPVIAAPVHTSARRGWGFYHTSEPAPVTLPAGFTGSSADLYFVFTVGPNGALREDEIAKAKDADVAIVFIGTSSHESIVHFNDYSGFRVASEGSDRGTIKFPAAQAELAKAVLEQNPNTIVVIQSVGTHDLRLFRDEAPAILFSSYNGQFQGTALAETLFGGNNPGGRLPVTWYESDDELDHFDDYHIRGENGKGRTYMFFTGKADYPFGYGLSYTTFAYGDVSLDKTSVAAGQSFEISVDVTNTGAVKGAEVAQVYLTTPDAGRFGTPEKMLMGFGRVELEPGETKTVKIPVNTFDFGMVLEDNGPRVITLGEYKLTVAKNAADPGIVQTITVTAADPWLHNVALEAGRVSIAPGASFQSKLSVMMSDERFFTGGNAQITYSSRVPGVASVDANGLVTAVAEGLTTITAAVTVGHVTLEDSFPLVVMVRPARADREPEEGSPPKSADFTTGVIDNSLWAIIRESAEMYTADANGLTIRTQPGDVMSGNNRNMFLQPAAGDWSVTADIHFPQFPRLDWQQGGLVAVDPTTGAFVKLVLESGNPSFFQMIAEGNGTPRAMRGADWNESGDGMVRLRLTRLGDSYYGAYYDFNNNEFIDISLMTIALDNVHAGVTAFNASAAPAIDVVFKNFIAQSLDGDAAGLTDILLDGQSLPNFILDYYEYLVTLPEDAPFPRIEAVWHGEMEVEVTQPTETAPAAVRVLRDGAGATYTIRFINGYVADPAVTPPPGELSPDETAGGPEETKGPPWLWIGLAVIAAGAGAGAFVLMKKKKKQ
jgi:beta-glucosidase-like glycosyl hydrolase